MHFKNLITKQKITKTSKLYRFDREKIQSGDLDWEDAFERQEQGP